MHTAKCWFLNLVILCFSFHLINASTLVINKENGQRPTVIFTPCHEDSDCAGFGAENFTCLNYYCKCDGTKFCVHPNKAGLNKLEESCSTNSDCMIEYSVCEKGKCQCEKDKAASLDKRSCLTNTTKDTCTNCSKTENTCSEGQCSCENGFVPNSDSTQCLKVAVVIDDFCEEDIQCSETFVNAVCINTSCQCPASYKFNSTVQTCVKKAALGGQCERDEECEQSSNATVSNRVSCLSGRCECKSQFVEKEGQCTSLLEPCIEPLCSEFSEKMRLNQTCVPGRCECPEERQFCTNTDSTWVNNLKKGNRTSGEYPSWIHRWIYTFPNLFIDYWLILVTVFVAICFHARDPRRGLYQALLSKFILPLIGYHTTVTTINEFGFVGYLILFFKCVLLPSLIGLALIALYNKITLLLLLRQRPIRRRRPARPEPQMYDPIPGRNLENQRTMPPSPNQPQQPTQNQPRGRGHNRGHGRGGRRNRHHH